MQDFDSHVTHGTILFENMTNRDSTQYQQKHPHDQWSKADRNTGGISNSVQIEPTKTDEVCPKAEE